MQKIVKKRWGQISWGVAASIALHVAVVAFFLVKLPEPPPEPPKEETVNVDLVPPPEEKKPEEKKPEEKKPEMPKIEEKAEKPPAPPPAPPPPPPPEAKPEEKPPEAPKSEAKNDPSGKEGKGQPMPVLRPVFEFGDKDTGPRKSETGNAAAEAGKPPVTPPDEQKPEEPKPVETAAAKPPVTDKPPANPVPEDVDLPQVDVANIDTPKDGPAAGAQDEAKVALEQAKPSEKPKTEQTEMAKAEKPSELKEAKTLFSQNETDDPIARTAIGSLPRGMRAAQLCSTELREQLVHGSPAYSPVMVPNYALPRGTVLDIRRGAFRTRDGWYDVQYRCEVDQGVTKVVSFAVDVGDPIPPNQWRARGFPEY
ncbi:DUF930 domain-containing protein [Rhizobium sp. P32RR-XVIII]|uniref:DUF930 domain-containing protein n=1 Tax=Rhizobium sp. P32RR-XVIII TaxID=2726738 RepID=UPI0014579058|nr:DUF930 domain-containing protein [Rhizobium sp. P32RR-XVIII]NLS04562.1 DUF930 domain-containing protein [Rhizobium sp. P32RR-XVIII]